MRSSLLTILHGQRNAQCVGKYIKLTVRASRGFRARWTNREGETPISRIVDSKIFIDTPRYTLRASSRHRSRLLDINELCNGPVRATILVRAAKFRERRVYYNP